MKIDERIILYLDNQMTDEERIVFEDELSGSPKLNKQLKDYKRTMQVFSVDEQEFKNEDYFVNLIPRFRESKLKTRSKTRFKISFAAAGLVTLITFFIIFFNLFKSDTNNSMAEIVGNMNDSEAYELMDYYSNSFSSNSYSELNVSSDSLFSNLISSELNIQESDLPRLISINNVNIENIYSQIEPAEAEVIYDQILSKKYF